MQIRPMRSQDAEACHILLEGSFAYNAGIWHQLPALWKDLLDSSKMIGAVVEDEHRSVGQRIVGFGTSVFLRPEFVEATADIPYLRNDVARRLLNDEPIVPDIKGVRAANAGDGLCLFLWDVAPGLSSTTEGFSPAAIAEREQINYKMIEAAFHMFGGYQLREILIEAYGSFTIDTYKQGGYYLRSEFANYFDGQPRPPADQHPYRFGLARDEANAQPFSYAASLFVHSPPLIGFTTAEQELLTRALYGLSDDELAQDLSISSNTVKAQWRAIYSRVIARHEALLPDERPNSSLRGQEKRRALLRYLRAHPSELRPH